MSGDSTFERFKLNTLIEEPSPRMRSFLEHAPGETADHFVSLLQEIDQAGVLEYKVKAILRVCACMILDHEHGVRAWSQAALRSGATKGEIIDAMYTLIPQVGAIPIIRMLPEVLELEDSDPHDDAPLQA